jgi:hypothetical protein
MALCMFDKPQLTTYRCNAMMLLHKIDGNKHVFLEINTSKDKK